MTNVQWFLLIGCLLLARGLAATIISRSPFTSAIVYLSAGLILGPTFLDIFHFDPVEQSAVLEVLTEIAVLISLFSAGVKMPVPITLKRWMPPIRLAWVSMTITVGLVAALCYLVLGLPIGAGILLGAILAPTDPVLATDVQVRHAGDVDQLRFTLTCEAGMNDGSAFPFVMLGMGLLGLHELGEFGWKWLAVDVVWATAGAILIGAIGGALVARLTWELRGKDPKHEVLDDLVGLGLIAVVYGACVGLKTWGFLAVFFAGVALRHTELSLAGARRNREGLLEVDSIKPDRSTPIEEAETTATVSEEALVFKEHLERLSELTLVLLLGGMMSMASWNWQSIGVALFLFIVARPISVMVGLAGTSTTRRIRSITSWFGVRGIGSVYYLMYAIQHGLPENLSRQFIDIVLVVVTISVFVHGTSVKPMMHRFWRPA